MSILSELQNKRLGLIELSAMGYSLLFKHPKTYLLVFCTILIPFLIILQATGVMLQENPSGLIILIFWIVFSILLFVSWIYYIAIAVITENLVYQKYDNYQNVIRKIFLNPIPLIVMTIKYGFIYMLRWFLLFIPGIIYLVNNQYYGLAYILRDQKGKAAFNYSRTIVKGNWWKVFLFLLFTIVVYSSLLILFNSILSNFIPQFWSSLIAQTLSSFFAVGFGIGSILLFFNLEFQKSNESLKK